MAFPPLALARDDATSTSTRIGATAFRAPTNRFPKMLIHDAPGISRPRAAPTIRPQRIRRMRLMEFHFSMIFILVS